jgi:hypothetical protein
METAKSELVVGASQLSSEPRVQFELNKLGETIAAEKCQGAGKVTREKVNNIHDPEIIDEIERIDCPGLKITTYIANYTFPPREFPQVLALQMHDPRISVEHSIGARAEAVIQELGPPHRRDATNLIYQTNIEALDSSAITFKIQDGVVKEILWNWYFP